MLLENIQSHLISKSIFYSNDSIADLPTVIGYEKLFKWRWFATQLNTFIVAVDLGNTLVTIDLMEKILDKSFIYASQNYKGWPRGLQSGIGVISILISSKLDPNVIEYCQNLKSGKKWAGFSIPVAVNSSSNEVHSFIKNPVWGKIYFPYFKNLIHEII